MYGVSTVVLPGGLQGVIRINTKMCKDFKIYVFKVFLEHLQAECLCGRYRVLTWAFVGLAEYVNTALKKVWDVKPLNLFLN